jgi:hypothetical protein
MKARTKGSRPTVADSQATLQALEALRAKLVERNAKLPEERKAAEASNASVAFSTSKTSDRRAVPGMPMERRLPRNARKMGLLSSMILVPPCMSEPSEIQFGWWRVSLAPPDLAGERLRRLDDGRIPVPTEPIPIRDAAK